MSMQQLITQSMLNDAHQKKNQKRPEHRALPKSKPKARTQLKDDIAAFLASGGTVKTVTSHCDAYETARRHVGGRCHMEYAAYGSIGAGVD